jgi:hypothetical protein
MKIPKVSIGEVLLGLSVAGLFILMVVLTYSRVQPPPVKFEGLAVVNPRIHSRDVMQVIAEVTRREANGCTNGVQAEAVDASNRVIRLPVPTREIAGNRSVYSIEMVDIEPGSYRLKLREVVYCSGSPKIAESNWTVFEVLP